MPETTSYVLGLRECFQKPLVTASILRLQTQVPHKASQPNANSTANPGTRSFSTCYTVQHPRCPEAFRQMPRWGTHYSKQSDPVLGQV